MIPRTGQGGGLIRLAMTLHCDVVRVKPQRAASALPSNRHVAPGVGRPVAYVSGHPAHARHLQRELLAFEKNSHRIRESARRLAARDIKQHPLPAVKTRGRRPHPERRAAVP